MNSVKLMHFITCNTFLIGFRSIYLPNRCFSAWTVRFLLLTTSVTSYFVFSSCRNCIARVLYLYSPRYTFSLVLASLLPIQWKSICIHILEYVCKTYVVIYDWCWSKLYMHVTFFNVYFCSVWHSSILFFLFCIW